MHFGRKSNPTERSPLSVQPTTFHTDRETKLLENYPTLKIDEKLHHDSFKTSQTENPIVETKIEELKVAHVKHSIPFLNKHDSQVFQVSDKIYVKPVVAEFKENSESNQPDDNVGTHFTTKINDKQVSNEVEPIIVTSIINNVDKQHVIQNLVDNTTVTSNEISIDASVPPPVNKRTKYLKRENSSEEALTDQHFLDRNSTLNSSGIARDESGIPLELPSHMTESAKWTHANRKSLTSSVKPEPMIRGKAPISPLSTVKPIDTYTDQNLNVQSHSNKIVVDTISSGKCFDIEQSQ